MNESRFPLPAGEGKDFTAMLVLTLLISHRFQKRLMW